jgi:hypothetical protein
MHTYDVRPGVPGPVLGLGQGLGQGLGAAPTGIPSGDGAHAVAPRTGVVPGALPTSSRAVLGCSRGLVVHPPSAPCEDRPEPWRDAAGSELRGSASLRSSHARGGPRAASTASRVGCVWPSCCCGCPCPTPAPSEMEGRVACQRSGLSTTRGPAFPAAGVTAAPPLLQRGLTPSRV